jgi:hypothetical protein
MEHRAGPEPTGRLPGPLVPLPFLVWASRTRRRDLWQRTAIYTVATIVGWAELLTAGTGILLGTTILVAFIDAMRVRDWLGDAGRRAWARDIVAELPELAAQWQIGRPDLTGGRLDGGLVDINTASGKAIRRFLGLRRSEADRVEEARKQQRLQGPDDLVTQAGIPRSTIERIEERLLFS